MRILLVDDDSSVVQSLAAILQSLPGEHDVRAATTAGQALQNAMSMGGVDLLITDVVMQPMDGFALRDQIATRYAGARTIFVTGFDLSEYEEQTTGCQVLLKPVEPEALLAAIAAELAPAAEEEPMAEAGTISAAAVATAPAPRAAAVAPGRAASSASILGHAIGAYQVLSLLGQGSWGCVYAAVQTSINRPVGLKILDPNRADDESAKARFLGDARAKAHVQHPSIIAVYEAGEASGHTFYTREFVDGRNLTELQRANERLDEPTALKVLKVAAEGLGYLHTHRIPHNAPQPTSIYVSMDGHPRLANLAKQHDDEQVPVEQEIQTVGRAMLAVLPAIQTVSPGFRALLGRMVQGGPQGFDSWAALLQGVKALEPKVIPIEAAKISAQDRAAIAAVEAARKAQKRSLYLSIGSMITLVLVAALVIWKFVLSGPGALREEMIHIPAGPFIFGQGQTVQLPEFWIDKYEVTIRQYGEFVAYLESHPTSEFDHPRQPKTKTAQMHKPRDWAVYYLRAKAGKPIHSVPSDFTMPMLVVDWWDAYAYAQWKGRVTGVERDLPTEQEWEKAARGTTGFEYPWGNEPDPAKVNSNADFVMHDPAAPGLIDGFNYWGPVNKQKDRSPFGVVGMAGNVAEWTSTWTRDNRFAILKGGSYMSGDVRLTERKDNVPPDTVQENIGFRTVTRSKPIP